MSPAGASPESVSSTAMSPSAAATPTMSSPPPSTPRWLPLTVFSPDSPRVVMVSETLVRRLWPGQSAVGRQLVINYTAGTYPYEIVGVVGDLRFRGPRNKAPRRPRGLLHRQLGDDGRALRAGLSPTAVRARVSVFQRM